MNKRNSALLNLTALALLALTAVTPSKVRADGGAVDTMTLFRSQNGPLGTCNLPPIPAPGQTVTWTLAGSPYEICQNITIPSTSTVIVEAGVHINFDPDMQVIVLGTMQLQGQDGEDVGFG